MRRKRRSWGCTAVQPVLTASAGGQTASLTNWDIQCLSPDHPSGLRSSCIAALILQAISHASLQHVHHRRCPTFQPQNRVSLMCNWSQRSPFRATAGWDLASCYEEVRWDVWRNSCCCHQLWWLFELLECFLSYFKSHTFVILTCFQIKYT